MSEPATITGSQQHFPVVSALNPNPLPPVYDDDLEWIKAYLTLHFLSDSSYTYAYILWFAIAALLLVFSLFHALGLRGGYIGAWWSKWSLRRRTWRKKHALAVALKKGQHRQPNSLPSNAQILSLTTLIVCSLALAYVGPDYFAPGAQIWSLQDSPIASVTTRISSEDTAPSTAPPQFTIQKEWWTTAARTGGIAFTLFPLCILLALKAPPFAIFSISFLSNLHFDKLAWLHQWCGMLVWFLSTMHVVSWSVQLALDHRSSTGKIAYVYAWQYPNFIYGWTAYGLLTLLVLFSLPWFRGPHYEAFWFLHVLLFPMMLILAAIHHSQVWWWCWAALALWIGERIYRFTWYLNTNGFFGGMQASKSQNPKLKKKGSLTPRPFMPESVQMHTLSMHGDKLKVQDQSIPYPSASSVHQYNALHGDSYVPLPGFFHAELLPGRTVRLRLITPGFLSWVPGQHFLINVPAICRFTSHPFTCASVCDESATTDEGRELVFLIRAKKGWTKDLWDTVARLTANSQKHYPGESIPSNCELPPRGVLMRGMVDGPFGSSARADWGTHSTVLLVAGGSGCSFGLSVLQYMAMCLAGRDGKTLGGRKGGYGKPGFNTKRVRFIWLVREFSHIQWAASALRRCMAMVHCPELQVDIFVTNAKPKLAKQVQLNPPYPLDANDSGIFTPPVPQFVQESRMSMKSMKSARRHSDSSIGSVDSDTSNDSDVDLSYYAGEFNDAERDVEREDDILDLTNWDGDDDTALPGEAQLNLTVKKEGKKRRSYTRRTSMAVFAKEDLDRRNSSFVYDGAPAPSQVRLVPQRQSSFVGVLEPITEHIRHANAARGPLSPPLPSASPNIEPPTPSTALTTPNSAIPLLPVKPSPPTSPTSMTRPMSTMSMTSQVSAWSDSASLVALMSAAHAQEHIRLELDETELADISVVAERARPGKPKFDRLLADEVERSKGSIVVGCCGPTSLNAMIRKSIAAQINPERIRLGDMRGSIALVSEDFSW
ncbi:hypothetical protein C8Q75DRAFT_708957 [Abortiporus biennis]|nr:hypothetical protein C8Q75DRAFT_708957 [Abortiporus biennis]